MNRLRETIIFAPGVKANELLKSMALQGINTINVKICAAAQLARTSLMLSGTAITEDFINRREEEVLISRAVEGIRYFGRPSCNDIVTLTSAINRLRMLSGDDEAKEIKETLSKGSFGEKNSALIRVYENYMALLEGEHRIDGIALIRKAINEGGKIEADFMLLEEYPLSPLEKALLDKLSNGVYKTENLCTLLEKEEMDVSIAGYKNCYGAANEVESILEDIYKNHRTDTCTVAVTDAGTYSQLFFDYACRYDLPISFGTGIPVTNSNPAKLLNLYHHWRTDGFFSPQSLLDMINSSVFNREAFFEEALPDRPENFSISKFFETLGSIRFTDDARTNREKLEQFKTALCREEAFILPDDKKAVTENERKKSYLPYLERIAAILSGNTEDFIAGFAYLRNHGSTFTHELLARLDRAAQSAIYENLRISGNADLQQNENEDERIRSILAMNVCRQKSEPGKLYVTDISGAGNTLRENLYIAGLSASKYPGSPRENHLLLDEDLLLFGEKGRAYTSAARITRKREQLLSLAGIFSACGANINVSYAGFNVSDLKADNPSSMIFELFRKQHGEGAHGDALEEQIRTVGYFDPAVSSARLVGEAYNKGYNIEPDANRGKTTEESIGWQMPERFSPSALGTFFECPRRFLLHYILHLPEPEDDKPFEIISAADFGTLGHTMMERLANNRIPREEFLRMSEDLFDRFLAMKPPVVADVSATKADFLDMMGEAWAADPHNEVVLAEEDIEACHQSGVTLHGYPDRVEKLSDGTYLIVDYKTGRKVKHEANDPGSCFQAIVYAYLMEQKGYNVSGCEFRYIRAGEVVPCRYDEGMKDFLNQVLLTFKGALEAKEFPLAPEDIRAEACKYCRYGEICGLSQQNNW